MTGARHDCSRTRGMSDRLVSGVVRDDDRRHAATCPSCGPVFTRAARFEDELEKSAQQMIAEDLPRGILDPGIARLASGHGRFERGPAVGVRSAGGEARSCVDRYLRQTAVAVDEAPADPLQ